MRHLKSFNESKILDKSVVDECKDILLELEDKGIEKQVNRPDNNTWLSFTFSKKEEFDYSDIEDVVERLKSYLSEYGLKIEWQSPKERRDSEPTIKTTRVMNPISFTLDSLRTTCDLYFN